MNEYISVRDLSGKLVAIDSGALLDELAKNDFKVCGMTFDCMVIFLKHYQMRRGKMPVTSKEIDRVFNEERLEAIIARAKELLIETHRDKAEEMLLYHTLSQ